MTTSREVHLKSRPVGMPKPDNFEVKSVDVPAPGPGEVQVQNLFMSVDPYMRGRMMDRKSYAAPFNLGEAMYGGAVGKVVASNDPSLKQGDLVQSMMGWREVFNAPAKSVQKLPGVGLPPQAFLGVAGMPGLTAYVGLLRIAELKADDVVFVSAASGAVGQIVAQIAKIKGNRVIGSAGGAEKCAFLKEIGVDEVIDYKAEADITKALIRAAPDGIDVYFDNVGGAHLDAALAAAKPFGRFALCGMIASYNAVEKADPVYNMMFSVGKSLKLQGFIVSNHSDMLPAFLGDMSKWLAEGKIKTRETIDEGIDNAAGAFLKLFTGDNFGKMLVKLA
jgi:NADPH-dependent curcumin reductase CurA